MTERISKQGQASSALTRDNPFLSCAKNAGIKDHPRPEQTYMYYIRESLSENTRQAYGADLKHFSDWGGKFPASPELIAQYLADHADTLAPASLARRVATLSKVHNANGWANPCRSEIVSATLRGVKRRKGTAQNQARPLLREELFQLLDFMHPDLRSQRDRALLLVGWAGGLRSSELVGLDIDDTEDVREGLILRLRRSKTDQLGQGRKIGIPLGRTHYCPVTALLAWRKTAGNLHGPIFRPIDRHENVKSVRLRPDAVSTILRDRLIRSGKNPEGYSGHSLRSGLVTSAIKAGVPTYKVRAQTGHASDIMLARYLRDAALFEGNAVSELL